MPLELLLAILWVVSSASRHSERPSRIEQFDQIVFRALPFTQIFCADVALILPR
jgi:hypothetical protein